MIKLTRGINDYLYVNSRHIITFESYNGKGSLVDIVGHGDWEVVQESPEEIYRAIKALRPD